MVSIGTLRHGRSQPGRLQQAVQQRDACLWEIAERRLLAHSRDRLVRLSPSMIARLTHRIQPDAPVCQSLTAPGAHPGPSQRLFRSRAEACSQIGAGSQSLGRCICGFGCEQAPHPVTGQPALQLHEHTGAAPRRFPPVCTP